MNKMLIVGIILFFQIQISQQLSQEGFIQLTNLQQQAPSFSQFIKFDKIFSSTPRVLVTLNGFQMSNNLPNPFGFSIQAESVQLDGFFLRVERDYFQQVDFIGVNYFASTDSNVQIFHFNVSYEQVEENRLKLFWPNDIELPFDDFEGQIFLTGFSFINNIDPSSLLICDLSFNKLDYSGLQVFFGPRGKNIQYFNADWVSFTVIVSSWEFFNAQTNDLDDSWDEFDQFADPSLSRFYKVSNEFEEGLLQNTPPRIPGIIGFQLNQASNFWVGMQNLQLSDVEIAYEILLDYGTSVQKLSTGYFLYKETLDCAYLYSQCDYQGEQLAVCEGTPVSEIQQQQWQDKQILSIQVPFGRTLTLFDNSNLQGPYTQFSESQHCLDSHKWTYQ